MTPTQLQAWIRNKSKATGIPAHLISRSYMMGKLIELIVDSDYKERFIIKGGFLLGSMVGLEKRATMDIDTSIRDMSLTENELKTMFDDIIREPTKEGIQFMVTKMKNIRENNFYPGIRVMMIAQLENMKVDLKVDITTGEIRYADMVQYYYELPFEERIIEITAYPVEQILAEKLQTMLFLEDGNTRARDFYDIHLLRSLKEIDYVRLYDLLRKTCNIRGMGDLIKDYFDESWPVISTSNELLNHWEKYRNSESNPYAKEINFDEVLASCQDVLDEVINSEKQKIDE